MGGSLNRLRWGGDPDKLDPETGLSKKDICNIKKSWALMYADHEEHGLQMFLRMFRLNPLTQEYFNSVKNKSEEEIKNSLPFKAHIITVMSAINMVVNNLHQPSVAEVLLHNLGSSHRNSNVDIKHFDEIKAVIIGILKNDLYASDDVVASWTRLFAFMCKHIYEKMQEN